MTLRKLVDGWQLETFSKYRGAMDDAPKCMRAWARWLRLARGLGWARHRPSGIRGSFQAYMTSADWRLMQAPDLDMGDRHRLWGSIAKFLGHAYSTSADWRLMQGLDLRSRPWPAPDLDMGDCRRHWGRIANFLVLVAEHHRRVKFYNL